MTFVPSKKIGPTAKERAKSKKTAKPRKEKGNQKKEKKSAASERNTVQMMSCPTW